jgi:signal transduction histidine kinase
MVAAIGAERWLGIARVGWVVLAAVVIALPVAAIPLDLAQLRSTCTDESVCQAGRLTPRGLRLLEDIGLSLDSYAWLSVAVETLAGAVWIAAAALVVWRRPRDPTALLTGWFLLAGAVGVAYGSVREIAASSHPAWAFVVAVIHMFAAIAVGWFMAIFPDGRWVPGWARWLPLGWGAFALPHVLFPGSDALLLPVMIALVAASVYAQVWRYRHDSDVVQRQQIKFVVFGLSGALGGWIAVEIIGNTAFADQLRAGSPWVLLFNAAVRAAWLLVPLSIGAAVLHYRLWDIEPIVNRTLVYGALTVAVAGLYVLVVGYFAVFFKVNDSPLVGLLATGVIAVVFQPLRERLQRGVNRLLYGQRDEPYVVLSRLGQRLESIVAPEAVLPTIVQSVAEALKLPYVAIVLTTDASHEVAASHGTPVTAVGRWPLAYQTEPIGELLVAPRASGEDFSVADRRLLDDLAHHVGIAAYGVRLTRDLRRLATDLQLARERLVTAREEERRRLRRDLHDGIGPSLASLVQRVDAATRLVSRDPETAVAVLIDLKTQAKATVAGIRQLVYALRPPALDELGLVSAIREHAALHLEPAGLRVTVEAPSPFPTLPAAVEVAAFRIVLEALTNVARHADAHSCCVRLTCGPDLFVEVSDDGRGFTSGMRAGVGLTSMRERAAELGGECVVEAGLTGGTRVWARLPQPSQATKV